MEDDPGGGIRDYDIVIGPEPPDVLLFDGRPGHDAMDITDQLWRDRLVLLLEDEAHCLIVVDNHLLAVGLRLPARHEHLFCLLPGCCSTFENT